MIAIVGIVAFLTVLILSLLVTRIASTALAYTGLSEEVARFQARSAFTGTGFTSRETEKVVAHPVRRRIIMMLMVARSAGLVTILISLIISFAESGELSRLTRLVWLVGGAAAVWMVVSTPLMDRLLRSAVRWSLQRWTGLDTRDYARLLNVHRTYSVNEIRVKEGDWLAGKRLRDCRLPEEGVTVLGIYRADGSYLGVPRADTEIYPGDKMLLYGRSKDLRELSFRRDDIKGQMAHKRAVDDQKSHESRQAHQEQQYNRKQERQGGR